MATEIERMSRIPQALQDVFLASNRGEDVIVAPPNKMAAKFFGRVMMSRRPSNILTPRRATSTSIHSLSQSQRGNNRVALLVDPQQCYPPQPVHTREESRTTTTTTTGGIAERCVSPAKSSGDQTTLEMATSSGSCPAKSPNKRMPSRATTSSPTKSPSKKSTNRSITPLNSPSKRRIATISPQDYLNSLMRNRGYDISYYHTLDTGFHKPTSELQMASYHPHIINLAQTNPKDLGALLCTGLSANPCNIHGESLLHSVCRKKNLPALQVLIECGTDLLVSDDYGRTPLHDACWNEEPDFQLIDCLLTSTPDGPRYLFHTLDRHGGSPLSYVDKMAWHEWLCYLAARKDTYWPALQSGPPEETTLWKTLKAKPGSLQVANPVAVLPARIASDVASGRLRPSEAMLFVELEDDDDDDDDSSDSSWFESDGSSSDDDDDDISMSDEDDEEKGSYEIEEESDDCHEEATMGSSGSSGSMEIEKPPNGTEPTSTGSDNDDDVGSFLRRVSSWGQLDLPVVARPRTSFRDLDTSWGNASLAL